MIKSPFRVPRHYKFSYTPRYYDPNVEEKDNGRAEISFGRKAREARSPLITGKFGTRRVVNRNKRSGASQSLRTLLIAFLLTAIAGYMLGMVSLTVVILVSCMSLFFIFLNIRRS